jgi:hypothetical protein
VSKQKKKSSVFHVTSLKPMPYPLTADALIKELNFANFIRDKNELENLISKCKKVLEAQGQNTDRVHFSGPIHELVLGHG